MLPASWEVQVASISFGPCTAPSKQRNRVRNLASNLHNTTWYLERKINYRIPVTAQVRRASGNRTKQVLRITMPRTSCSATSYNGRKVILTTGIRRIHSYTRRLFSRCSRGYRVCHWAVLQMSSIRLIWPWSGLSCQYRWPTAVSPLIAQR